MTLDHTGLKDGAIPFPLPTLSDPWPPLPLEVDDAYIFRDRILAQPVGVVSELTGFNTNVRIYRACNPIAVLDISNIDNHIDLNQQKRIISSCLREVQAVTVNLPPELAFPSIPVPRYLDKPHSTTTRESGYGGKSKAPSGDWRTGHTDHRVKRFIQYDVQRANIYSSQIATRSKLLEKFWELHDARRRESSIKPPSPVAAVSGPGTPSSPQASSKPQPPQLKHIQNNDYSGGHSSQHNTNINAVTTPSPTNSSSPSASAQASSPNSPAPQSIQHERESLAHDFLVLLRSVHRDDMEANGLSFTMKLRQVASTLLGMPGDRIGGVENHVKGLMEEFLNVLVKLERVGPGLEKRLGAGTGEEEEGAGNFAAGGGCVDNTSTMMDDEDEDQELRAWSGLREFQKKFAEMGGFLS